MKKRYFILIAVLLVAVSTMQSQNDSIYFWKSGGMAHKQSIKPADLDSITFKRPVPVITNVTICGQVWTTKNLDVTTYSDGTPIPQVTNPTVWNTLTTGAWCYYKNDSANNAVYGKLYNWYAVAGIHDEASLTNPALRKKLAPTGWHVPTDAEWTTLTNCLGGSSIAGGKMKAIGTSQAGTGLWKSPNTAATNSSGFTGLPGGILFYDGAFDFIGVYGYWWSTTKDTAENAWYRALDYNFDDASRDSIYMTSALSVRCVKD